MLTLYEPVTGQPVLLAKQMVVLLQAVAQLQSPAGESKVMLGLQSWRGDGWGGGGLLPRI